MDIGWLSKDLDGYRRDYAKPIHNLADHDDFLATCWHDHLTNLWKSYPYKPGICSSGVTRFGIENGERSRFQSASTGDPVESYH